MPSIRPRYKTALIKVTFSSYAVAAEGQVPANDRLFCSLPAMVV